MPARIVDDEGCDCLLDDDIFALPFPFRRQPPLKLVVFARVDKRGRKLYVKAKVGDLMAGRKV